MDLIISSNREPSTLNQNTNNERLFARLWELMKLNRLILISYFGLRTCSQIALQTWLNTRWQLNLHNTKPPTQSPSIKSDGCLPLSQYLFSFQQIFLPLAFVWECLNRDSCKYQLLYVHGGRLLSESIIIEFITPHLYYYCLLLYIYILSFYHYLHISTAF